MSIGEKRLEAAEPGSTRAPVGAGLAEADVDGFNDEGNLKPPQPTGTGPGRFPSFGMPLERSKDLGGSLRRLAGRLRPERLLLGTIIILALLGVFLSVLGPRMLGHATDVLLRGLLHRPRAIDFHALHRTLEAVVFLYLGSSAFNYAQSYLLAGVIQRTMYRLRSDVEDKLNRLPLSYVDGAARGDLLSRVTNDIDNLAQSMQQTIAQLLTSTLLLVGTGVMMFVISPWLAMVVMVSLPLSMVLIRFIMRRSRVRFMAQWRYTGHLNALVEESLTGHNIVKTFGRQREVEDVFRRTNDELYRSSFSAQWISSSIQPAMVFVGNINFVSVAVIGGLLVHAGSMTIGGIQAFIQYSRQFAQPMQMLASMTNMFQSGLASAERVFEFLDGEEESRDETAERRQRAAEPSRQRRDATAPAMDGNGRVAKGRVEFEHISFSYDPDHPLIDDLSLVAEPGKTVAIVGHTGAGKTTLVNLIMRFYELDGGRILLDGRDIAKMPRAEVRSNVGMVLQDTWLFNGTIRDNIAYGNPSATNEQILAAARATYVDRFVHALPHGYDTVIDDEGTAISIGEKQLLTIARAFLADPTILILDEATSSVDTRTEVLIQNAMAALRSERTSFVIAHRLSTIRNADTILVMEHGRIVEQGNHGELLARRGAYADLYNAQFTSAAVDLDLEATLEAGATPPRVSSGPGGPFGGPGAPGGAGDRRVSGV